MTASRTREGLCDGRAPPIAGDKVVLDWPKRSALEDELISFPLVFLALTRRLNLSVVAYPHKSDYGVWCFKLNRAAVIIIDAKGRVGWKNVSPSQRSQMEVVLDHARRLSVLAR